MKNILKFLLLIGLLCANQLESYAQVKTKKERRARITERNRPTVNTTVNIESSLLLQTNKKFLHKGTFKGKINGNGATVVFDILKGEKNKKLSFLHIYLTEHQKNSRSKNTYWGVIKNPLGKHMVENIELENERTKKKLLVEKLFFHQMDKNHVSMIFNKCRVGNFSKNGDHLPTNDVRAFSGDLEFPGKYIGKMNGRDVILRIDDKDGIYLITFHEVSTNKTYGRYFKNLPVAKCKNSLAEIELFNPEWTQSIKIPLLVWHREDKNLVTGHVIQNKAKLGLSLKRALDYIIISQNMNEFVLPGTPSSQKNIDISSSEFSTLGAVDQYLSSIVEPEFYNNCQRYFNISPGHGFAFITPLEKVQCDGSPAQEDERWNVGKEDEGFKLSDILEWLRFAEPDKYRMFIFTVTDQDIRTAGRTANMAEMAKYLNNGAPKLPENLVEKQYTRAHRVTAYVYQFEKRKGNKDGLLIQMGASCWQRTGVHLRNTGMAQLDE